MTTRTLSVRRKAPRLVQKRLLTVGLEKSAKMTKKRKLNQKKPLLMLTKLLLKKLLLLPHDGAARRQKRFSTLAP